MKKRIIKLLTNSRIKRIYKVYNNKVNSVFGADKNVDGALILLHRAKWGKFSSFPVNIKWLNAYVNSTKIESPDFVPENIYYTLIEPILNNPQLQTAYADKNFYELVFPQNLFPAVVLRNINGGFYTDSYTPLNLSSNEELQTIITQHAALIVKPAIESGGGENIYLFRQTGNKMIDSSGIELTLEFLQSHFRQNYIVQKILSQHPDLRKFNKTSINTIRVLTYLSPVTGNVEVLHCILRVGAQGQFVDNSRSGGFAIGVKPDGRLNQFATNKIGEHFTEVNGIDLLQKHAIPMYDEIKIKAKEISLNYIHFRLLGLDMILDDNNNIRCVEINNSGNEINFYQFNNGPLFGKFTDEVIEYCIENRDRLNENYTL